MISIVWTESRDLICLGLAELVGQLKAQEKQASNFTYYEAKGKLYFDQNGAKKGYGDEGGLFAILKGGPDLTESSFLIV